MATFKRILNLENYIFTFLFYLSFTAQLTLLFAGKNSLGKA